MPCTTILVGKKASYDGSTMIATDIDLNFDADYQARAHAYTRELLSTPEENKLYKAGETVDSPHVIRAGTISCSEEKNAIGYVKGYYERVLKKPVALNDNAYVKYLASKCTGVKKTTGLNRCGRRSGHELL